MNRGSLERLSKDDLIALALAQADAIAQQAAQIAALTRRVEELEAKLGRPPKTPDNSSVPPSQGQKPNQAERRTKARKGRPGAFRPLSAAPDRVIEVHAPACPHCDHALTAADQPEFHAYDHIELPPVRPVVTRVHRHRGVCPCCRRGFSAPAPEGMAPGSPFGPGLAALVLHLHVTQAIGFERLALLMDEVFGVRLSEGAIANILARAEAPLIAAAEAIAETVRASKVVASDETSARVQGRNWWQWVLLSSTAVYHVIADSRAARVATEALNRGPQWRQARGLGRRPLLRAERAWRPASALPRPPAARRSVRRRRRRCRLRAPLPAAAPARGRHRATARSSQGHDPRPIPR